MISVVCTSAASSTPTAASTAASTSPSGPVTVKNALPPMPRAELHLDDAHPGRLRGRVGGAHRRRDGRGLDDAQRFDAVGGARLARQRGPQLRRGAAAGTACRRRDRPPTSTPTRNDSSTAATSPSTSTRNFPGLIASARISRTGARLSIASATRWPRAIDAARRAPARVPSPDCGPDQTIRKYSFNVQRRSRVKLRTVVSPSPVGDAIVNDV